MSCTYLIEWKSYEYSAGALCLHYFLTSVFLYPHFFFLHIYLLPLSLFLPLPFFSKRCCNDKYFRFLNKFYKISKSLPPTNQLDNPKTHKSHITISNTPNIANGSHYTVHSSLTTLAGSPLTEPLCNRPNASFY